MKETHHIYIELVAGEENCVDVDFEGHSTAEDVWKGIQERGGFGFTEGNFSGWVPMAHIAYLTVENL